MTANGEVRRLPPPLVLFLIGQIALVSISLLFVWAAKYRWNGGNVGPGFPYPFGLRWWHDYTVFQERFRFLHSTTFFSDSVPGEPFEYPAAAALVYCSFYAIPAGLAAFLALTFGSVAGLACWLARAMERRGLNIWRTALFVVVSLALSYPFWFAFATGNIEICIFLLLAAGLIALLLGRPLIAAMLFGVIGAMKIFPLVFLALLIPQRRYRVIAAGLGTAIGLNVVALWVLCPNIGYASRGIAAGLAVNRAVYILPFKPLNTSADHSLIGFAKRLLHEFGVNHLSAAVLAMYLAVAAAVGLLVYFFNIRKLPVLNQILLLTIVAVLLPPTSHDYTLIHLYIPWALCVLYLLDGEGTRNLRGMSSAFICFAVIFSPEYMLMYHGVGFSAQVKCIALVVLSLLAVLNPWTKVDGLIDQS